MYKHLEQEPPPPSRFNPKIPPQVEVIILRALAKRPEDRFDNAGEMARQLKIAIGMTVDHVSYPEVSPALRKTRIFQRPRSRLRHYWPVGALAVLILAVIVGVFIVTRPGGAVTSHPNVQEDATGKATDLTLTDADVSTARQQLGAGRFVAYITCNQTSEYHAAQGRELRDLFTADNLPFRIYDSNNDKGLQLTQIEKARADGAAALIVCALDTEVLHQSLLSVQTAELPLILLNPGEENYGGVGLLSDNYLLGLKPGQLAGQVIRDELGGQADVVILDYPDLPIIVERANALEEGIKELAPDANIIGRYKGGIRDVAKESVSELLAEGVRFEVVASINDAGSFGAIDALAEAEIDPSTVMIFSVDAEALARQYIRQGYYMRASLDTGRTEASNAAVSSMIYLLAGKPIPERIVVPPGDMITREVLESGDG
jgi:ABC-type sugar transport system substrate-binding protein